MNVLKDKLASLGFFVAGAAVALVLTFSNNWIPVGTGAEPKDAPAPPVAEKPALPVVLDQKAVDLAEGLSKAFEQVAASVSPAVVHIYTSKTLKAHSFEQPF